MPTRSVTSRPPTNGWRTIPGTRALFSRHQGWMRLGEPERARKDLNAVIELDPDVAAFMCRGEVYRNLGDHAEALKDFARAEAIDPQDWENDIVVGLLYQADSHARLGDEAAAFSCCARLPDDFWTPGLSGAPSGNKTEVAAKLRAIAAEVRRGGVQPGNATSQN